MAARVSHMIYPWHPYFWREIPLKSTACVPGSASRGSMSFCPSWRGWVNLNQKRRILFIELVLSFRGLLCDYVNTYIYIHTYTHTYIYMYDYNLCIAMIWTRNWDEFSVAMGQILGLRARAAHLSPTSVSALHHFWYSPSPIWCFIESVFQFVASLVLYDLKTTIIIWDRKPPF